MEAGHWVLVLGTSLARIVRDLQGAGAPARSELIVRAPNNHLRRMIADGSIWLRMRAEGRPDLGAGWAVLAEDDGEFVRQVVALLERHRRSGDLGRLSVIAVPRMLALLRDTMTTSLRTLVDREVAGNLALVVTGDLSELVRRELWPGGGHRP